MVKPEITNDGIQMQLDRITQEIEKLISQKEKNTNNQKVDKELDKQLGEKITNMTQEFDKYYSIIREISKGTLSEERKEELRKGKLRVMKKTFMNLKPGKNADYDFYVNSVKELLNTDVRVDLDKIDLDKIDLDKIVMLKIVKRGTFTDEEKTLRKVRDIEYDEKNNWTLYPKDNEIFLLETDQKNSKDIFKISLNSRNYKSINKENFEKENPNFIEGELIITKTQDTRQIEVNYQSRQQKTKAPADAKKQAIADAKQAKKDAKKQAKQEKDEQKQARTQEQAQKKAEAVQAKAKAALARAQEQAQKKAKEKQEKDEQKQARTQVQAQKKA